MAPSSIFSSIVPSPFSPKSEPFERNNKLIKLKYFTFICESNNTLSSHATVHSSWTWAWRDGNKESREIFTFSSGSWIGRLKVSSISIVYRISRGKRRWNYAVRGSVSRSTTIAQCYSSINASSSTSWTAYWTVSQFANLD